MALTLTKTIKRPIQIRNKKLHMTTFVDVKRSTFQLQLFILTLSLNIMEFHQKEPTGIKSKILLIILSVVKNLMNLSISI